MGKIKQRILAGAAALAMSAGVLTGATAATVVTAEPAQAMTVTSTFYKSVKVITSTGVRYEKWLMQKRDYGWWEFGKKDGWYMQPKGHPSYLMGTWIYYKPTAPPLGTLTVIYY